eukprot:gnl/MRDRNA2_/MRDRNA2_95734_c0_seq1.p1 gnl/MRDRNA2_/MRDRNA2_95734_c0~~gnl/MRDRNA2_/MRDRNA2_95734_c0_seq1.p1  ORF type:complete len:129 (+),score=30.48 gnl/MRDRNA2_/MRDRNA2_95734_c0_seq1:39-425(+)
MLDDLSKVDVSGTDRPSLDAERSALVTGCHGQVDKLFSSWNGTSSDVINLLEERAALLKEVASLQSRHADLSISVRHLNAESDKTDLVLKKQHLTRLENERVLGEQQAEIERIRRTLQELRQRHPLRD